MVISVKSLFARQKSKIYALEIKDEKINEDIARIIKKLKEVEGTIYHFFTESELQRLLKGFHIMEF